jgi:hypothetical protein
VSAVEWSSALAKAGASAGGDSVTLAAWVEIALDSSAKANAYFIQ